jgi:hypothetical protein
LDNSRVFGHPAELSLVNLISLITIEAWLRNAQRIIGPLEATYRKPIKRHTQEMKRWNWRGGIGARRQRFRVEQKRQLGW